MPKLDVTSKIIHYITEKQIAINQISKDTSIPEVKLKGDSKEKLSAGEFLDLCYYLNIKPEQFNEK